MREEPDPRDAPGAGLRSDRRGTPGYSARAMRSARERDSRTQSFSAIPR